MKNESDFNALALSGLGQSASIFAISIMEKMEEYPIKVLTADMATLAGLDRFKISYPDSFYDVGIAEQNMIGIASGLAAEGYKAVAVAQANFITMRCFEQVRQFLGYMQNNVILVGINSGFALTFMGNTHYTIEDISLMRGIPCMTVLSPSDAGQAVKIFEAALQLKTPVYIRLMGGTNNPIIYENDFDYKIGKSSIVQEGSDVVIFATGSMVHRAMMAAQQLNKKSIYVRVIDCHTVKPLDIEIIDRSKTSKLFVTIEEHNIIGGLGSSISEYISEQGNFPPLLKLGIKDTFSIPGDYEYLLTQHRLVPELIVEDIINRYNRINL